MKTDNRRHAGPELLDAPPTEDELRQAEALREALEGRGEDADAEWLRGLKLAVDPPGLTPDENEWLVAKALRGARKRKTIRAALGVGSLLAVAASVALVIGLEGRGSPSAPVQEWRLSHSTEALAVKAQGNSTDRLDRIVHERARDYRHNLFLRWGVR